MVYRFNHFQVVDNILLDYFDKTEGLSKLSHFIFDEIVYKDIKDSYDIVCLDKHALLTTNKFEYINNEPEIVRLMIRLGYCEEIDKGKRSINNPQGSGVQTGKLILFKITDKAIYKIHELVTKPEKLNNVFVAMSFRECRNEFATTYKDFINNELRLKPDNKLRYIRIDEEEFKNAIIDEIKAKIKSCRFIIADLTHNRGGVYWEAGYASGLGRDVIYTVDDKYWNKNDSSINKYEQGVHFDVSHLPIIRYTNVDDLKRKLAKRINAITENILVPEKYLQD